MKAGIICDAIMIDKGKVVAKNCQMLDEKGTIYNFETILLEIPK